MHHSRSRGSVMNGNSGRSRVMDQCGLLLDYGHGRSLLDCGCRSMLNDGLDVRNRSRGLQEGGSSQGVSEALGRFRKWPLEPTRRPSCMRRPEERRRQHVVLQPAPGRGLRRRLALLERMPEQR
ncbi:hypothetical protein MRX96_026506 [Rhipicephalus microplus]